MALCLTLAALISSVLQQHCIACSLDVFVTHAGKDAASPRYITTMLSLLSRLLFNPSDEPLLKFKDDDGKRIEPKWYLPIIPMVLVNGAEGVLRLRLSAL